MKKFIKILAVLMAMLMLISMATACKTTDDDMDSFLDGSTNINGNDDNGDSGDVDIDNEGDDPSNTTDGGKEDGKENGKGNDKNTDKKDPNKNNTSGDKVDQEKLNELIKDYDETKKYDMDSNPLLAEAKPLNTGVAPGFDMDTTGFVKNNVKLADLKGKTFIMITSIDQPFFQYRGENGSMVDEWEWWDALRDTYGLKVKYIKTTVQKALAQNLTYQTSGKQVDVMPTHRAYFPQWLNLSQGLNDYVNEKYMGNSPGIDNVTLTESKWDGTYRCISPIGAVDAIWYNETMVDQLGLKDPHETWKAGKWDWNAWKDFLVSVPAQGPTGLTLAPWNQPETDAINFWPQSYGITLFPIDKTSDTPKLVNNFNDPRCASAWEFYAATAKGVDFVARRTSSNPQNEMYTAGTVIMNATSYLCVDYSASNFAKSNRFNWVPYPAAPTAEGTNYVMNYGATMMLPRKMKVQKNAPYAVKFMELWANRFTEAINDNLKSAEWYSFNYAQRKEYFEYAIKNVKFGVGSYVLEGSLSGDELEYSHQLKWSMYNNNWNTATAVEQLRNLAQKACDEAVKYGT